MKRIEAANNRLRVVFTRQGAEHAAEADRVINGAGRVANVDTLDLAAGRVEHGNGRVAVDCHLRSTSNPAVYVCGDALPISPQLSPIATYEGDIVGRNIVEGPKYSPDYASMATSVYTVPALAAAASFDDAWRERRPLFAPTHRCVQFACSLQSPALTDTTEVPRSSPPRCAMPAWK